MDNSVFLLNKLVERDGIPIHIFNRTGECIYSSERVGIDRFLSVTHEMVAPLVEYWKQTKLPSVLQDEFGLTFGFMDVEATVYIWGPFTENPLNMTELRQVREKYGIQNKDVLMKTAPLFQLISDIQIVFLFLTGEQLEETKILRAAVSDDSIYSVQEVDMDRYRFMNSENNAQHISYKAEQVIMDAVRNGDVTYLQGMSYDMGYAHAGKLAKSKKKHLEYVAVSGVTMVTRAAIEGGMPPSEAYNLSDLYLQKLESCRSTVEIINLSTEATLDFVKRVKQLRERKERSTYVEQCKDYIKSNIHHPIRVEEIADNLSVNRSYLSSRFKESEGISIKDYITKERLRVACNMLKYSEESIAVISEFLCFNSQSHFGKIFRQEMKLTPFEYRQKNKSRDIEQN